MKVLYIIFCIIGTLFLVFLMMVAMKPDVFLDFNNSLANVSNVISYFSIALAIVSILITLIALIITSAKPNLKIQICNGERPVLNVIRDGDFQGIRQYKVEEIMHTDWYIKLVNIGNVSAKNIYVKFIFYDNVDRIGSSMGEHKGYKEEGFIHGGGYQGRVWEQQNDNIVYPQSYKELPKMNFNDCVICEGFRFQVFIACDNMKMKKQKFRVKLRV